MLCWGLRIRYCSHGHGRFRYFAVGVANVGSTPTKLKTALVGAFADAGADINIAKRLFGLARGAGLREVQYRPFLVGFRSVDPLSDYLPMTVESLRATILRAGLMADTELDAALSDCRAHLRDPGTVSTLYTVAQVWGRMPVAEHRAADRRSL